MYSVRDAMMVALIDTFHLEEEMLIHIQGAFDFCESIDSSKMLEFYVSNSSSGKDSAKIDAIFLMSEEFIYEIKDFETTLSICMMPYKGLINSWQITELEDEKSRELNVRLREG